MRSPGAVQTQRQRDFWFPRILLDEAKEDQRASQSHSSVVVWLVWELLSTLFKKRGFFRWICFYFICMDALSACTSPVHNTQGGQKGELDPFGTGVTDGS